MDDHKNCLHCGQILRGRPDKKYCDDHCRSSYNNRQNTEISRVMRNTNHILRKNRRILAQLLSCRGTKKFIRRDLEELGFNFHYYTHQFETVRGNVYQACYDVGYRVMPDERIVIRKSAIREHTMLVPARLMEKEESLAWKYSGRSGVQ